MPRSKRSMQKMYSQLRREKKEISYGEHPYKDIHEAELDKRNYWGFTDSTPYNAIINIIHGSNE